MKSYDIDAHNICLLNFHDIYKDIEIDIINDLFRFDLIKEFNFQKKDIKKIFFHHIIHNTCNEIINHLTFNKIILFFNSKEVASSTRLKGIQTTRFEKFLVNLFKKINNTLPIRLYQSDDIFDDVCKILGKKRSGERKELVSSLGVIKNNVKTFEAAKKFAKLYELNFLSEQFFDKVKTKNLMFS